MSTLDETVLLGPLQFRYNYLQVLRPSLSLCTGVVSRVILRPYPRSFSHEVTMPTHTDADKQVQPCPIVPAGSPRADQTIVDEGEVPLPIALRETTLTPEAASEIQRILDDPSHPAHAGREMTSADASILRKNASS